MGGLPGCMLRIKRYILVFMNCLEYFEFTGNKRRRNASYRDGDRENTIPRPPETVRSDEKQRRS